MRELALYGGRPVRERPLPPMYPGALMIDENEERAVIEVIRSKSLFRYYGPNLLHKADRFEKMFAEYIGVKHALGLTSGTAALFVALRALGIEPKDEVIVPAYAWISTPAMVAALGATPVLASIDYSLTIDPSDVRKRLSPKTKAIIPVHMRGAPCDMDQIMELAEEYDLKVLEDVAQACGGAYKGRKLGSIGHVAAFSFQLNKIITAGEGGALTTNEEQLYKRALAAHDVAAYYRRPGYVPPLLGLNFRMNELTAAILIEQLRKIDKILYLMRRHKRRLREEISQITGLKMREIHDEEGDTGICVVFFLNDPETARKFVKALRAENINASTLYAPGRLDGHVCEGWLPILRERMKLDPEVRRCTIDILSRAVHIDVPPILTEEDADTIIRGIDKVARVLL